ncbi:Putative intracellular protease/amidase [Cyclobacterium xiamenense]|uniref:Putative intracellular protease/amidase n=1 Tax=Cyclobacterium xiamenense TaxID=1297121 RepID=A0A1H6T5I3_9BACT|nr:type 1 glutamine amidotransferase domain-containing protein [Cyclobacterium xiamenense]SEI75353.1 Putative intracellular protease/amidase [Cyclobacterium xiamenense]
MKPSKKLIYVFAALLALVVILAVALPYILHFRGLHPDYDGETFDLSGKKALIVTTSHGVLNKPGETTGQPTGIFASEMTIPYYDFLDANMEVDVASIQGGKVPIDPQSFYYFVSAPEDERFLDDDIYKAKVENSFAVAEVDFKDYDLVFFGGGWGAAYDMNDSIVAAKVSDAYYNSDVIFGSVCHGALAFTEAKDKNGGYLVKGRTMTGVTQRQLKTFGIEYTPYHPELELKKAGAIYKAESKKILEPLNTLTVIDKEKRFVTGQNQNSSHETAHLMMKTLTELQ